MIHSAGPAESQSIQLPMSYSITAPFKALTHWNGHSLNLLSTEIKDGRPELLSKWKGFAVREGVIIGLASLILASPYLAKSTQALAFLAGGKVCVVVALATAATIAIRERRFAASHSRTKNAKILFEVNPQSYLNHALPKLTFAEAEYVEFLVRCEKESDSKRKKNPSGAWTQFIKSNPEIDLQSPRGIAEVLVGILSGETEGVTQEDFINSDFCFNGYLHLIFILFSNEDYRSKLAKNKDDSCMSLTFRVRINWLNKIILKSQKILFDVDDLDLAISRLEGFEKLSILHQNTLLLLEVFHNGMVNCGFSFDSRDSSTTPNKKGISEAFYKDYCRAVNGTDTLPNFEEFLSLVGPTDK